MFYNLFINIFAYTQIEIVIQNKYDTFLNHKMNMLLMYINLD